MNYDRIQYHMPPVQQNKIDIEKLAEAFIANPGEFTLYRGENMSNQGGLHFTTNKDWSKNFGTTILHGRLPTNAKVKLITLNDFETAFLQGVVSEGAFYKSIFADGYDAVIGHDARTPYVLDILVNPKLLGYFTQITNH